jgi:DNA-binding transcriptional MerR regulator
MVKSARAAPPAPAAPRYLLIGELAEMLRVTTRTVRNWVRAGKLPPPISPAGGSRNGSKRLWDPESVRRALIRLEMEASRGD